MKTIFSALSTLLLTTTLAFVGQVEADTSVQFGIGYRTDDINSKISVNDTVRLNTYSRLKFKDLEIFTITGKVKSTCGDCAYYRAEGQYGWIWDGDVRESDQLSQPVSVPLSADTLTCNFRPVLHNDVKGRYVADFNVAIGYPLQQCWCEGLQLIPTLGFSYDTQRVRYKDHDRVSDTVRSALGFDSSSSSSSSSHSRNKFRATWWGPFLGLDFAYNHQDCWNLYGELEFHWARARRERNSNLGLEQIDRYRRSRNAWGWNAKVGSIYFFRCNWFLDGHISYKRFTSHEHHDRLDWRSYAVGLDLGYAF